MWYLQDGTSWVWCGKESKPNERFTISEDGGVDPRRE